MNVRWRRGVDGLALQQHRSYSPGGSTSIRSMLEANSTCLFATPARTDAEVPDLVVNGVDHGLAVSADLVDVVVEVEDPVERLLRRDDVALS